MENLNSHLASVTHVHHVSLAVQIQIYGLGEVVEKKPLVGAIIRRLTGDPRCPLRDPSASSREGVVKHLPRCPRSGCVRRCGRRRLGLL